jgi:hypothetical protein
MTRQLTIHLPAYVHDALFKRLSSKIHGANQTVPELMEQEIIKILKQQLNHTTKLEN